MLSAERLTLRYRHRLVLDDVSLSVEAGSLVALLGGNAAGKTSLLRALAGLERPAPGGRVRFRGRDMTDLRPDERARQGLAFCPAERQLFPAMSVRDNLELGRLANPRGEARWTLEALCELFPVLPDRMGQRAGSLSGGEQKMVAIGRALLGEPALLMLDEPSLGLAPGLQETLAGAIRSLNAAGLTVLLTEQNVALAERLADRVVVLERGRVRARGGGSA